MVKTAEFSIPSGDGIHQLACYLWRPLGEVRGVVQVVHGVSEHLGRYQEFAHFLTDHGFAVWGADHLGHGKTAHPTERGYFAPEQGWHLVAEDVYRLRQYMAQQLPNLPYFLLGHSMGSFLTRTYLIDHPGTVTGAILSGTGQEPAVAVSFAKCLAQHSLRLKKGHLPNALIQHFSLDAYNRQFAPNRTSCDWISRDEVLVDAYAADPLCSFRPTAAMSADMMEGLQYIAKSKNLAKMDPTTPIYFFSGDRDPVGGNGKTVTRVFQWFQKAGCQHVTLKLYPDGRHEMLNEINRPAVYQDTLAWLEAHLPHS